ncbi:flagellar motor switch protein FliM [Gemmatimonadetes bacterium T265]|nr:flagellar motor switch protein FliM [Gemmatimonadetes bacterium T265]
MQSLSQNDIDRLLDATGGLAQPAAALGGMFGAPDADAEVQAYDFRRPHRISKERLRTLEAMYERMVKALEGWLISRVRGHVELRLQSVDQFTFGEFTQSLPTPSATYIFDVGGPGGTQGVVDVGGELAFFLVDRLFGGGGQAALLARALSPVERLALRTVAERTCQLVEEIWRDHVPLALHVTGFESSPEILQVANREDPVLVANIEVNVGQAASLLLVCLPFAALEKFFQGGGPRRASGPAGNDRERDEARERAERALRATPVAVSARLPAFRLSLRELGALIPGEVLATGIPRDAELTVLVGGRARYTGSAGRIGRRLAVRLQDSVAPAGAAGDEDPAHA